MTGTVFGGGVGAPIAGAPMKAQARLGLALSWRWITSAFLIDVAVLILASHLPGAPQTVAWWVVNRLTGRQLAAVRASLPSPAKRPPLVVPTRTLREDEQLTLRVGPTEADAAPQHSMRAAEASDDAQRVLGPKLGCRHVLWVASRPPWYTWSPLARVSLSAQVTLNRRRH
jgi:hypothetical protein